MDDTDVTENATAPQPSRERPLPTRFGRDKRAAVLAGRRHAPGSRSDADETPAVEAADDVSLFDDHGGL